MHPLEEHQLALTRRRFFSCAARGLGAGLGIAALSTLLGKPARAEARAIAAPRGPHFLPRAKRVIYMHMEGAPSQLDLFDYKPGLRQRYDEDLPDSVRQGQLLTGMTSSQTRFPVAPSIFRFSRYPNRHEGVWISELLPHTASVAGELCFIHSMQTEAINHEPGITFFQTGNQQPGRPSLGAWTSYGLGSANENLPSFVVLITQGTGNMQALSSRFWGSGFLPSEHQGCRLRSGKAPVLFLDDPPGVQHADRRALLDLVAELDEDEYARSLDPEIHARLAQFEMAYRMQMSMPELTDFSDEDAETLAMYGPDVHKPGSFAANCLLARRLNERGVRFVQLFMRGWDQHGNLPKEIRGQCQSVDQPQAALIRDLRRRGLLDETIVLWAGEFGRTAYSQGTLTADNYGRDHHPRCFTLWLAGAGIQPGITYGKTDDYSYNVIEKPVDVHDLHATMLKLLGFDHERLVFRHQGRDFRLTDVSGKVVQEILTCRRALRSALAAALALAGCRAAPAPQPAEHAPEPPPKVAAAPAPSAPHVQSLGQDTDLLWVDFAPVAASLDDAGIAAQLEPLAPRVGHLGLARAAVGARTLAVVASMPRLVRLDLGATPVHSAELGLLGALPELRTLNLVRTKLDGSAVPALLALPKLERVYVWGAGLRPEDLQRLRSGRPALAIECGEDPPAAALETEAAITLGRAPDATLPAPAPVIVNTLCPVTGLAVDAQQTVLFEGRLIGFCCPKCVAKFNADPASFRSKLP